LPGRLAGNNHVNLTVSDLDRSTAWYCRVFGLTVVSDHVSIGPPYFNDNTYNGLFDLSTLSYIVGLIQHPDAIAGSFDERRVGLDHFGLQVADPADLTDWVRHLDAEGVAHSGILSAPYADVINFRDPDSIALELSAIKLDFWTGLVTQAAEASEATATPTPGD
jgi:catechol 2,3-dioxygenase-like lactoylglutathione lyase family enzyme